LRKKQHEDYLVNDLRRKFGNAVLVFGDATIGDTKFHPHTSSLGIRDHLLCRIGGGAGQCNGAIPIAMWLKAAL